MKTNSGVTSYGGVTSYDAVTSYGDVTSYGGGWKKEVVNRRLEFLALDSLLLALVRKPDYTK